MQKFSVTVDIALIKSALIFAGKGDARYYLNGVRIESDASGTKVLSTDGHRLMIGQVSAQASSDPADFGPVGFLLERGTLEGALKVIGKASEVLVTFSQDDETTRATVGPVAFENPEKTWPEWRRLVPDQVSGELATFNAEYLHDCAKARKILGGGYPGIFPIHYNGDAGTPIMLRSDVMLILMPVRADRSEYERPEWIDAPKADAAAA
ncbi:MAG: hypothetical protein KGL39_47355 [Patescibacteria group bacterium]|nr:hypothetical protein [Patescibacteria group bacterium]